MNIQLNFISDADSVRFPVVAAALTPDRFWNHLYIYMFPFFVFILDDFFETLLVGHSWDLLFRKIG